MFKSNIQEIFRLASFLLALFGLTDPPDQSNFGILICVKQSSSVDRCSPDVSIMV